MIRVLFAFLLLTLTMSKNVNAQDSVYYYRPNGQRIFDTSMSPNDFVAKYFDPMLRYYSWNAYFEDKRLYVDQGVYDIVFKDLTATPYGLITKKKLAPATIEKILQRFNLTSYLNSKLLYDHLKDLVKDAKLSKQYLNETLGKPTRNTNATDIDNERWYYDQLKLEISFTDTIAVGFKSKNYSGNIERRNNVLDNIKYFEAPTDKYFDLTKVINKGKTHYTLELYSESEIYSSYAPLRIILKSGKEIRRNEDATSTTEASGTRSFGRFYLTQAEATLLATSLVTDFKLGDVHEVLPTENAESLKGYFKAVLNLK